MNHTKFDFCHICDAPISRLEFTLITEFGKKVCRDCVVDALAGEMKDKREQAEIRRVYYYQAVPGI